MSPTYAIDVDEEIRYVCEDDRSLPDGDNGKPVFFIRPLTIEQTAEVDDSIMESRGEDDGKKRSRKRRQQNITKMRLGSAIISILDYGLIRFENLRTRSGKEIVWNNAQRSKMYNYLPEDRRAEIADAIRNISEVGEEQMENLDSGPPSSPVSSVPSDAKSAVKS